MILINVSKEIYAFTIAILVIGSFVFFFGYSLIEKPTIDTAKEVTALFGGYVAAVLVYYFGQKQVQTLTNQAVDATTEKQITKLDSLDIVKNSELLEKRLQNIEQKWEGLNRILGDK